MKKSFVSSIALGLGVACLAPLAGNAYYCSVCPACNEDKVQAKEQAFKIDNTETLSALGVSSKSCVLMDKRTGKIILAKNENDQLPMASMTKMMTMLLLMEEIEKGTIGLNQMVTISEYSASQEGSECFLDAGKQYSVKELLKSVVVASANDSSVAIAELVAGSEELFAKRMNERAKSLGMTNTHYVNATGLDAKGHVSTASDMCKVMKELSNFPLIRQMSKVWMYDMEHSGGRVTNLTNTNRLVKTNPDCALAKTGHTDGAGYCITALGERGGMELIACVMGEQTSKSRFDSVTKLLQFGFTNFETRTILDDEKMIGTVKVKGGRQAVIEVYPEKDIAVMIVKGEQIETEEKVKMLEEIKAPVAEGTTVGTIEITANGETFETNLITRELVDEKTFKDIFTDLIRP